MFNATLAGQSLQTAIEPVQAIVDESKLRTHTDEFGTRAVDPANVAMVDITLTAEAFDNYDADDGVLGVDLGRLNDVANMAETDDLVTLDLNDETRKLEITVGGLDYTLALIDPDSIRQEPDIPELDPPATVTLEGKDLDRGITAADMVSDHVAFGVNADEDEFYVEADGDTDDVYLTLESDDLIDIEADDDAHSLFSLDYLKDMNKAIPSNAEVRVELGKEIPVKLHYDLLDGEGSVTYMLAPRIQSD